MGVIITGGEYRGRKLSTDTRAQVIRPTSGKVREALFSSLGEKVPGATFVDLFAGSGAVGLEALSRGAAEVYLVENHPQSWVLLKANCKAVVGEGPDAAKIFPTRSEAEAFCAKQKAQGRKFDLIFADPPFQIDFTDLPEQMQGILAPGGTAIIQFPMRNPPEWVKTTAKVKRYGESGVAFLESIF